MSGGAPSETRASSDLAAHLNALEDEEAEATFRRCCGATRWVSGMVSSRPFADTDAVHRAADEVFASLEKGDILEAFDHHPRIGADMDALRAKFASTASLSENEQAAVKDADEATLRALRDGNLRYEDRFGHIFIVCASGKSAAEMLALLEARMSNEADEELAIAAGEQAKITHLRLDALTR